LLGKSKYKKNPPERFEREIIIPRRVKMENKIIAMFCIIDDILKALNIEDDKRADMKNSEIITTALVSYLYFNLNYTKTLEVLKSLRLFTYTLEVSRFTRRLEKLEYLLEVIFYRFSDVFKNVSLYTKYVIDSKPIRICKNISISRCRLTGGSKVFRGYIPSTREYVYGVKVHLIVTEDGLPVEYEITPASTGDVDALYIMNIDIGEGSELIGDKAYNDYYAEDVLREQGGIEISPIRKKNSRRKDQWFVDSWKKKARRIIESIESVLDSMLPRKIHAVTFDGFIRKVRVALCGLSFHRLLHLCFVN
jgi:hypothetical protein